MPELPEVTTIINQLKKEITGSIIVDVESVGGYKTVPEFKAFRDKAIGQKVIGVRRIAKNIVVELKKDNYPSGNPVGEALYLVIHLAMTGRLLLRPPGFKPDPWTRIIFKLSLDESRIGSHELRFCDARMFGFARLMDAKELEQYAGKYGPDALDEKLTGEKLLARLKRKKTEVKRALLEQDLVAGAGNIYVNDSLWMAKIHPQTLTQDLEQGDAERLLGALQSILKESIQHRGSTLSDRMYIDVYGREGEHQKYFRIFGKNGEPCPRCGIKIESVEIGGRGTFFCPQCQKKKLADSCKNNQPSLI